MRLSFVGFFAAWTVACGGHPGNPMQPSPFEPPPVVQDIIIPATLTFAGDIADCSQRNDANGLIGIQHLAKVLDTVGLQGGENSTSLFLAGGDLSYFRKYAECYHIYLGKFLSATRPVPGNHDVDITGLAEYFGYFGIAAHPPNGYYSFNMPGNMWHIIAINSNFDPGSPEQIAQLQWLERDLIQYKDVPCSVMYMHYPLFSSGQSGMNTRAWVLPYARKFHEYNGEAIFAGHDHIYERFRPQTPEGVVDYQRGIHMFVVGTGGANLSGRNIRQENSDAFEDSLWGALIFRMNGRNFSWEFRDANGSSHDPGLGVCH